MTSTILILFVVALHFYFLWLEMFGWQGPRAARVFRLEPGFARDTAVLAANQGLYNGFLAAGLIVGLWLSDTAMIVYLLLCVAVAGLYGAATATRAAAFAQTVPATLALLALWAGI